VLIAFDFISDPPKWTSIEDIPKSAEVEREYLDFAINMQPFTKKGAIFLFSFYSLDCSIALPPLFLMLIFS